MSLEGACHGIRAMLHHRLGAAAELGSGFRSLTLGDLVNPAFAARGLLWHLLTSP